MERPIRNAGRASINNYPYTKRIVSQKRVRDFGKHDQRKLALKNRWNVQFPLIEPQYSAHEL